MGMNLKQVGDSKPIPIARAAGQQDLNFGERAIDLLIEISALQAERTELNTQIKETKKRLAEVVDAAQAVRSGN